MQTLEPAPAASSLMLELSRVIRAPRAQVYEAWTNPEIAQQWFGPAGMFCPTMAFDVRPGGAYRMEVASTPEAIAANPDAAKRGGVATGNYTQVVPNELLQFTWDPSWNPGEHTLVTVSLRDVTEGTEITLRHEKFLTEQSRDGHNLGWTGCLDKLTTQLQN